MVMKMQRMFWTKLENWDNSNNRKPLIVYGARQVGKTYIINEYLSKYKNYLKIDLINDDRLIDIYKLKLSNDKKFERIELEYNISLNNVTLFIDEVQKCLGIIEDLKYLYLKYPNLRIVVAGSLLGVSYRENEELSMPVGYVDIEYMYPLNFREFLTVTNNERYIPIIEKSYNENKPLDDLMHRNLLDLYYKFLFLGGMPEVIKNYLDNNQNIVDMDKKIVESIINIYKDDMTKYIKNNQKRMRIERIYDDILPQLSKENPKFTFAKIDSSDNRKRDYISALDWLLRSKIIEQCTQVTKCEYPLNFFKDNNSYKLFLNDTGLMCNIGNVSPNNIVMDGDYQAKEIIAENYVANELKKNNFDLLYYSKKSINNQSMEIDFLVQIDDKVIPIEVKANSDSQSKSLKSYIKEFNPPFAIRMSTKNFGLENNIKSVPLYAAFCIRNEEKF